MTPQASVTVGQLAAMNRALAGYRATLDTLDGNLVDGNLAADADGAAVLVRSLLSAATVTDSVTLGLRS